MTGERFTIRCPDHILSDGRLLGLDMPGVWKDTYEEAEDFAAEQSAHHRAAGLDCQFEVITDEFPLDLSPAMAYRAVQSGTDVLQGVLAGLITIAGHGADELTAVPEGGLDATG